ncbi:C1 family peptidase [Chryseobacterium oryctis]|uniref:C1 family peptidase n=1 Tax=Chryseobacterium oryctis TaxID=2952618 RepID=A0ABT3HLN2_9FLAO|nr:C1 family peptidase [Chryseobacterium oryctis]MCW3160700.1 C1 family peptidase [Chryseobacterium oryctis]
MKNFKLIAFLLGMLSISSCDNSSEEIKQANEPEVNQKMYSLGAKFVDPQTYESYQKVDLEALTMKYMGKNASAAKTTLPSSYTITSSPVGNQGAEGSCVAWATAYAAASSLEYNFKGMTFPNATRSPEYVYNQIKIGTCAQGAYVTTGLNLIKNQGVCSWSEMPYTDTSCSTLPNTAQKNAASTHKFTSWATVNKTDLTAVKTLLSMKLPVIIAVTVDDAFYNMGSTGWIWKSHSGKNYGGHAICVVGYDDAKQAFKVQNSWGTSWGQSGYFWIDYSFFAKSFGGAINECYVAYVQ